MGAPSHLSRTASLITLEALQTTRQISSLAGRLAVKSSKISFRGFLKWQHLRIRMKMWFMSLCTSRSRRSFSSSKRCSDKKLSSRGKRGTSDSSRASTGAQTPWRTMPLCKLTQSVRPSSSNLTSRPSSSSAVCYLEKQTLSQMIQVK